VSETGFCSQKMMESKNSVLLFKSEKCDSNRFL
jgi:hypothetical protein